MSRVMSPSQLVDYFRTADICVLCEVGDRIGVWYKSLDTWICLECVMTAIDEMIGPHPECNCCEFCNDLGSKV